MLKIVYIKLIGHVRKCGEIKTTQNSNRNTFMHAITFKLMYQTVLSQYIKDSALFLFPK